MTNGTVLTIHNRIKEIKVQIWNKPVCLGCGSPLIDEGHNSANFIGSMCGECHFTLKHHNMVLPDFTKPEA